jgi:hypothetical protein
VVDERVLLHGDLLSQIEGPFETRLGYIVTYMGREPAHVMIVPDPAKQEIGLIIASREPKHCASSHARQASRR